MRCSCPPIAKKIKRCLVGQPMNWTTDDKPVLCSALVVKYGIGLYCLYFWVRVPPATSGVFLL